MTPTCDLEIADTALYRDVKKSFPHVGVSAAQARECHRGRWEARYMAPPQPLPPYPRGEAEAFAEQMTAALSEGLERSAVLAMTAVGAASPQDLCRRQLQKLLAYFQVPTSDVSDFCLLATHSLRVAPHLSSLRVD